MKPYQRIEIDGKLYGWDGEHAWTIARGGVAMPDLAGSRVTDAALVQRIRMRSFQRG